MFYLVFDKDDDLLDILAFENASEVEKFKLNNPEYSVRREDDFIFLEDEDEDEDDFSDEYEDMEW